MTETQSLLPHYMDSTMMSCARTCLQKFHTEFCLGLRPAETSIDLHAGGCVSASLESFYRATYEDGLDTPSATGRALARFFHEWDDFEPKKDTAKTRENMWAAVESYIQKYPPRTDHVQPYSFDGQTSVEFSFAIPLEPAAPWADVIGDKEKYFPLHPVTGEPWIYVGRFDLLGELTNGASRQVVIRDEKTAGRLETNWSDKWNLRSQFLGYCWALQQMGINCSTVVVRGIIITKKEIRQVEAIKPYSQFLIERWHEQLRRDLWRITRAWQEQYFDWNLGEACTMYGNCPFMDRCTSPHPDRWNSSYKVARWNPLARNPIAETSIASPSTSIAKIASLGLAIPPNPTLELARIP